MISAAFLISLFQLVVSMHFTKEVNCINASDTLEYVKNCPGSKISDSFKDRSERKNCSQYQSCNGKQLYYHCVRYNKSIVEVCSERVTLTGEYCNIFEEGIERVAEDLYERCFKCQFQRDSDEIFSECVKPANETNRTNGITEEYTSSGAPTATQQDNSSYKIAASTIVFIIPVAVLVLLEVLL